MLIPLLRENGHYMKSWSVVGKTIANGHISLIKYHTKWIFIYDTQ